MRISGRLILHTVLIAFFSVVITSVIVGLSAYYMGKKAIEQQATEHLVALREAKKEEIERYFNTIRNQLLTFANDIMIVNAMQDFTNSYMEYKTESIASKKGKLDASKVKEYVGEFVRQFQRENGSNQAIDTKNLFNFSNESSFLLQYNYIIDNPNPLGEKYLLDSANDGTKYSEYHAKYHPVIREYMKKFGYYDVFLIDPKTAEVVYTVFKEVDFASSLKTGLSTNSGLGNVFREALSAEKRGQTFISDFSPYYASYNEQAAFIATPIYKDDVIIGILVFQFPIDVINNVMTYNKRWEDVGLGDTGETYLVGADYRLRSMSRFFIESPNKYLELMQKIGLSDSTIAMIKDNQSTIGLQPVITQGTKTVFDEKKPGFNIFRDYRDVPVLSAYTPLNIPELNWALMSEMDVSEAFESVTSFSKQIILITVIVALAGVLISIIIGAKLNSNISVPIVHLNDTIKSITKDMDLTKKIKVTSADEIGEVSVALNQLIETFRETLEATIDSTRKVENASLELRSLSELADLTNEDQVQKIVNAEKDLHDLSIKLKSLSSQFKVLEEKFEEEEDW